MKTYRWENRFLAFVFGISEANAFSCFKIWDTFGGNDLLHSDFKSRLAFSLLEKILSTNLVLNAKKLDSDVRVTWMPCARNAISSTFPKSMPKVRSSNYFLKYS
ncbi:hypothetical protein BDF21DRAFT_403017 [Thamnidium elegans]|nr:hypothetical protein BDF21DRAFT_403017 [Thamnidium elegans]